MNAGLNRAVKIDAETLRASKLKMQATMQTPMQATMQTPIQAANVGFTNIGSGSAVKINPSALQARVVF